MFRDTQRFRTAHLAPVLRATLVVAFALGACDGVIGDLPDEGQGDTIGRRDQQQCTTLAKPPLRRLTNTEYRYAVKDLLGVAGDPTREFSADDLNLGFAVGLNVSTLHVEQYMDAAEELADKVELASPLVPCEVKKGDRACAAKFIDRFARRAYRRRLTDADRKALLVLYDKAEAQGGFAAGIRLVIEGVLQSPDFLYRIERGQKSGSTGARRLTQHELAARMSFLLWRSVPDETLLDAADGGKLSTAAQVEAQARRMLADERARRTVRDFFDQLLELGDLDDTDKSDKLYPQYGDALAEDMKRETHAFIDHVVWKADGRLSTLLTASYSFVDERLAKLYGVSGVQGNDRLVRVTLPQNKRAGLLTQASVMTVLANTAEGSPIHRGLFVRKQLLCQPPPPPPDNFEIDPVGVDSKLPIRKRYSEHRDNDACSGCHSLMDPIGFGFLHYDAIGRYLERDGGKPVDATGKIVKTDVDGSFDGAVELAKKLSRSKQVQRCMVRQLFRYTFSRGDGAKDRCTIDALARRFAAEQHDVRELLVALVRSDAFRLLSRKGS